MMTSLTDEQKRSVESIDFNVLVSAGAGSGKTHVLVERYIEILRCNAELTVSNLVAVTYTTKAANEMRSRLKSRMQELLKAAGETERERWSQCLSGVDGARIGTIHALCESILKAFPVEAAIDPRFEVLNELERAELLASCLERSVHEAAAEGGEDGALLMAYPVDQIELWVNMLVGSSLQFQEGREILKGLSDEDLELHAAKLLAAQQRIAIEKTLTNGSWSALVDYLRQNPWSKGGLLEEHRLNILRLADAASGGNLKADGDGDARRRLSDLKAILDVKVATAGGNAEAAKEMRARIKELKALIIEHSEDLELVLLPEDKEAFRCLRGLLLLAERVLGHFRDEKKVGMRLDFNDMILSAYQILSNPHSQARKFFNESIRAILVDEFQDTNRLQADLLHKLAGDGTRLFLIGDDKQSIYKFQGADVSIFNEWRGNFESNNVKENGNGDRETEKRVPVKLSGESLLVNLGTSFRSHPQIVAFVNAVFEGLMPEESPEVSYKARFRPLGAFRDDPTGEPRVDVVMFDATDPAGERKADEARRLEARTVAAWITEKVLSRHTIVEKGSGGARPIRFGDFAVLVQRNDEFKEIEDALAELEIPYVTMAASGFLNRQEVYDLENVLRFLWCQQDDQSLFGALRSPLFGVSDDVLHQVRSEVHASLWAGCLEFSRRNAGICPELERAVDSLRSLLALARTRSLAELVRAIIVGTKYDITLLAVPGGKQRSRNIWKLAGLADENGHLSIAEFVNMLDRMRELKVKQTHAPLDGGDSVKLMTIHGSKGLEFPAVALPALSGDVLGKSRKLLFHRQYGLSFDITRDSKAQKPAFFLLCRRLERDMEQAERRRLLYVATTRARDYLGIFMERGGKNVLSFKSWLQDALELDRDGATTPDGVYFVRGSGGESSCSVQSSNLDGAARRQEDLRASLSAYNQARAAAQAELTGAVPTESQLRFDLLAPLRFDEKVSPINWQSTLRVTPDGANLEPEATVLGTFFHAIMQHLSDRVEPPSRTLLAELAAGAGIALVHPRKLERLLVLGEELLNKFWGGSLYELMKNARRRIHEAPYMLLSTDGTVAPEVGVSGRSDLLLEAEDGRWYVVDYKTDEFDLYELNQQVNRHRPQLEAYVRHIEILTGVKAKPALYFARYGIFSELD